MKCSHAPVRFFSNPFSTRYVVPGAVPWGAAAGQSLPCLANRFLGELGGKATIVGPHGSGKSTLLSQLVPLLGELRWRQLEPYGPLRPSIANSAGNSPTIRSVAHSRKDSTSAVDSIGRGIVWLVLRRRQPLKRQALLPHILRSRVYWCAGGLLVLDGLEQLRSWEYAVVRLCLRTAGLGLLATCHQNYWTLPCLVDTTPNPHTLQQLIVGRLARCADVPPELRQQLTDLQLIQRMLTEEQGSVREIFMRLYDVVENLRQPGPVTSTVGNEHRSPFLTGNNQWLRG